MSMSPTFIRHVSAVLSICYGGMVLMPSHRVYAAVPSPHGSWQPPSIIRTVEGRRNLPGPVTPPVVISALPRTPTQGDFAKFRVLRQPALGSEHARASDQQKEQLARALERYADRAAEAPATRIRVLTDYLAANPTSPFAGSVWADVLVSAEASGNLALAFQAAEAAWDAHKTATVAAGGAEEVVLTESVLARLLSLSVRTGRKAFLNHLLLSLEGRPVHVKSAGAIAEAREAVKTWERDPIVSSQCGLTAYNTLAAVLGKPALPRYPQALANGNNEPHVWGEAAHDGPPSAEAEKQEIIEHGLSAARLLKRINDVGGDFRVVRRLSGEAIPAPSVVHFQFADGEGHFSALIASQGLFTEISDPHLQLTGKIENATLNAQISGYFLVPAATPLPEGFREATDDESVAVYGRQAAQCVSGKCPDKCNSPDGDCGMPVYALSEFLPGVLISDRPLTYQPLYGPGIDMKLVYRQVQLDNNDDLSQVSNLGPRWSHAFLSYIHAKDDLDVLPTASPNNLRWVTSEGTFWNYTPNGTAWSKSFPSCPDLTLRAGGGYKLTFDDGSILEFGQANSTTAATRYYLSKVTDAQGLSLTLSYDTNYRLATIQDATGGFTSFGYVGASTKIASITDPYSRTASFTYNDDGMLASVTDAIGITSTFAYSPTIPDRIASMTTPYGTTTFVLEGSAPNSGYANNWSVSAIDPSGQTEKIETYYYHDKVPSIVAEEQPTTITVGGVAVTMLTPVPGSHHQVSFHWTKKYWGEYKKAEANDLAVDPHDFAHVSIWLMDSAAIAQSVPLATREPGLAMEWYNYPGQTAALGGSRMGTSNSPSLTARKVENATGTAVWTLTQQTYNVLGLPLVSIDELGRKTQRTYATNNQDVLTEQVWNGSAWNVLRTYTYPAGTANHHLPATITEASGKITTFTRNAKDQVTQVQLSKSTSNEKVRYTYDTAGTGTIPAWPGNPGLLRRIERTDPVTPANWVTTDTMTYDSCNRLRTQTDASGYTRTFDYDAFDRVTLITYPDTTTEQFDYQRGLGATVTQSLDITASKDRAGRWTRTVYNTNRQPALQITPDGKTTKLDWCKCGSIWKLTDPLGRVTEWKRDIQGRPYEKRMPDGTTKTTYTYEPLSGRLATVKRPNEQAGSTPTVTYRYNLDGSLQKEDYTDAATPDVTYQYTTTLNGTVQDPLGRLRFVQDGLGTHTLTYAALTAGTAGAGQLSTHDGPIANDDHVYTYDWQDRVNLRKIQTDAAAITRSDTRTWDSLGRLKTVANLSGTTGLGTFTYGYTTNLSRPDTLTSPDLDSTAAVKQLVTTYAYYGNSEAASKAQRLNSIAHVFNGSAVSSHTFDYDPAGRITSWVKTASALSGTPADSANTFGYNLSDEVTSAQNSNTPLAAQTWAYDDGGNWLATGTPGQMSARTHDSMNRLDHIGGAGKTVVEGSLNEFAEVSVTSGTVGTDPAVPATLMSEPGGGYRFRAEVSVQEGSNTLTVAATDRDTPTANTTTKNYTFNVAAVERTFTYDLNGNMLTDSNGRTFTWDAKNRLKSVTAAGTTYRWDYDYRDRRVKEYQYPASSPITALAYVNPSKLLIWEGDELVQERSVTGSTQAAINTNLAAGGTITHTHHFGGFTLGATGATKYLTTTDHLGNVREVIAASGTSPAIGSVVTRYDYTTFQGPTTPVKLAGTNVDASLLTIGRYYHKTLGSGLDLELALYRAYDPGLGRWLNEDPLQEDGGLNLYGYVGNGPTHFSDPLGLQAESVTPNPVTAAEAIALAEGYGSAALMRAALALKAAQVACKVKRAAQKVKRISNPKHHKNSISPEPKNVEKLYENAVLDKNGVGWAKGSDGTIHRFSQPRNGECHWNGSTGGVDPIKQNNIPNEILNLFK